MGASCDAGRFSFLRVLVTDLPVVSWQIFGRDRVGGRLAIPEDGDDPVAIAVLEQLDGVDSALEGFAVFRVA